MLHYYTISLHKPEYKYHKKSGCYEYLGQTQLASRKMSNGMFELSGLCLLELGAWLCLKTGINAECFSVREHVGTAYNAVIACGSVR